MERSEPAIRSQATDAIHLPGNQRDTGKVAVMRNRSLLSSAARLLLRSMASLCAIILLANFPIAPFARGQSSVQATVGSVEPITPSTIQLWPNGAPGALGTAATDQPTLTVYLPAQNPTHTGIVVCPGGGYIELATDLEGTQVAHWLNARGVAAFVLTYRLGPRYHYPIELLDAQRAIRYVRSHSAENGLDPTHIGIWGFSAGGHLASTAGTHFDQGHSNATDPIDRASSRPDFLVLAYPVISMEPGITHAGSLHNLLGEQPNPMLQNELSNETQVTTETPPTFLFSTTKDQAVPVMNSVLFYEALLRAGVPAELHIFEQGRHGSGLGIGNPQLSMWPILLQNWLHLHGWMATSAQ
jgi:acetyl esterase/lipase